MTDRYAVIGNPIAHSKSPQIHAMFAEQTGQDMSYEKLLAPIDGFLDTIEKFRSEGGRGANVTLPVKLEAYDLAKQLSPRARHARAANTLSFSDSQIQADNTDGVGLIRDITANLDFDPAGKRVLLMGAGGAARGVLLPLLEVRPAILVIANRTVDKALRLAQANQHYSDASQTVVSGHSYEDLSGQHFDLVINATSSSLSDTIPPLPDGVFAPGSLAYDMMYGKGLTAFLAFAEEQNAHRLADGLGMLVEQAAASFQIWRSVRPETQPVVSALRRG